MYAGLMALAVILTVAGVGMVVFGIPINALSLGNTLIVSGTTAICGGLVLVGLAAAYRQLRRIADALTRAGPRVPRPLDLADPHTPGSLRTPAPPVARIPLPPRDPEDHGEFRVREPHPQHGAESLPVYRTEVRSDYPPDARGDFRTEGRSEPPPEYRHDRRAEARPESRYAPREQRSESRHQSAARSSPADYAGDRQRARTARSTAEEADAYDPDAGANQGMRLKLPASIAAVFGPRASSAPAETDTAPPQRAAHPEHETETATTRPLVPEEPEPPQPEAAPPLPASPGPAEAEPEEAEFTTVLKSGVVDGLAYTLYADGSIAAELPEGRRRFGSIDELRAHLEQNDG